MKYRKTQPVLKPFCKAENYFTTREVARADFIDSVCGGVIPARTEKESIEARCKLVNDGGHYYAVAYPAKEEKAGKRAAGRPTTKGYRPGRKSQSRRQKRVRR